MTEKVWPFTFLELSKILKNSAPLRGPTEGFSTLTQKTAMIYLDFTT